MIPGQVEGNVNTGWSAPAVSNAAPSGSSGGGDTFSAVNAGLGMFTKILATGAQSYTNYNALKQQAYYMGIEASVIDYAADLKAWEADLQAYETSIEQDIHRDQVRRILGKQAAGYAHGGISVADPDGTPMVMMVSTKFRADMDEAMLVWRGKAKRAMTKAEESQLRFRATSTRAAAGMVGGSAKTAAMTPFVNLMKSEIV